MKKHYILLLTILTSLVFARDFTKPPSVALRTEVSYISVAILKSKKILSNNEFLIEFDLVSDIYNHADSTFNIITQSSLARNLELNVKYIMAYQAYKKIKRNGVGKYVLIKNGPVLLNVEGASPAIFKYEKRIAQQLKINPKIANNNPKFLLDSIFQGMDSNDAKIQEFFIRELINWNTIHQYISKSQFKKLYDIFVSNASSTGTLTALLEARSSIHKGIGINKMYPKVVNLLENIPITLEQSSEVPTLILHALKFLKVNKLGNINNYKRWIGCNIPTISELALLSMAQLDLSATLSFAQLRQQDTIINPASRRVLKRFVAQYKKDLVE